MRPLITAVRHAPPICSGLCAGRFELPVQVHAARLPALVQELQPLTLASIYTSPSRRCHGLASELATGLGLPLIVDERLVELDFGEWEGQTWDDISRHDAARFRAWNRDWRVAAPPGGECLNDIEMRVREFLDSLDSQPVLLITHAGVIRTLRVLVQSVPWQQAMADSVPYLTSLVI
jgi:alpha-ribazole phosphatase